MKTKQYSVNKKGGRTRSRACEDAMEAVRNGMTRYAAADAFGLSKRTVYLAHAQDVKDGLAQPVVKEVQP